MKHCADCRAGEHDNYDDDVKLVVLRDPDTNRIVKRSYMCTNHRRMYDYDGYEIHEQ